MLVYFVIAPILTGLFLYFFYSARVTKVIAIAVQIGLCVAASYLFFAVRENNIVTNIGNYESVLGIMLMADSLASVFILLSAFIFLIAAIYSFHENNSPLFWFLLFFGKAYCLVFSLHGTFSTYLF